MTIEEMNIELFDLSIRKDISGRSFKYHQKGMGCGGTKTKKIAAQDMRDDKSITSIYIYEEYLVLMIKKYDFTYIPI